MTIGKMLNIHILTELYTDDAQASLNILGPYIQGTNKIAFIPDDVNAKFTKAQELEEFSDLDTISDNSRNVCLNVAVNLETYDDVDPDYEIMLDSIGDLEIHFNNIIAIGSAMLEKDAKLVIEDLKDSADAEDDDDQPEEKDNQILEPNITAEVIEENVDQLNEDSDEDGPAWVASFDLHNVNEALEDESENTEEVIIHAPDAETAARLADQHARIQARENDAWSNAEVIGIRKQ